MTRLLAAAACAALTLPCAFPPAALAQNAIAPAALAPVTFGPATPGPCRGTPLAGTVRDSTSALIPGATLTLDYSALSTTSAADGTFRFPCVPLDAHKLTGSAEGFAARDFPLALPRAGRLDLTLQPASVETIVAVDGNDQSAAEASANASGPSQTISGSRLQSLADDPDDLQRQLQQLAAASGGNPANTTISVDGFQGSSALPPKSSIAYIKINPDQFSAEYREPPFDGARVEVYTRPGQKAFHGALFTTNGSPFENARDPFSTSKAPLGKQRYGFELSGPVRRTGSDFALTLEHRSIDDFAVVDAFTLAPSGGIQNISANVATPQRLWLGTARLDWQLGPRNTFISTYSANVNHQQNAGVGGSYLAESGWDRQRYEHMLRFSNITTASAHLMHEARLSLRWDGEDDLPTSTAPQLQVAGAFTGGGASIGRQQLHELNVEFDDDAILTTGKHTLKLGTQMMLYDEHQQLTTNFNGTYVFGGGSAPALDSTGNPIAGQTTSITGLEQYRRALAGLPGGSPTAYTSVTGTPAVTFTQLQDALFLQDDWKLPHGILISSGVRYFFQTSPTSLNSLNPRLGILWSPGKKGTWTLHAHGGLFSGRFNERTNAEVLREDGIDRITRTVYNPLFNNPFSAGATPIATLRQYAPHIQNLTWGGWNLGGTRTLPAGFNLSVDFYDGRIWNDTRSVNVNAPTGGLPTGPRPGPANTNILQLNNSGQGKVSAEFAGLENHKFKRVQFFFGGVHVDLIDDTNDDEFASPQNSYSDAGEFARRSGQTSWNLFGNATLTLPAQLQFSTNFNGGGDAHYNITTGFDNNGDGNFNDRPRYAAPGTPGAIQTPFGLLTSSGGTGVFPRNKGVMPWTFYVDANLQRAFKLTRNAKAEHQQTLTVNLRSSNALNHLNVTSVGGVLGSPQFGQAYAADNGRRIEAGLRYSF